MSLYQPNPYIYSRLLPRNNPTATVPRRQPPPPEEEDHEDGSINLKDLSRFAANTSISGLSALGNFLDVPGSVVRDVSTWMPGGIPAQNPFDQLLPWNWFTSDKRVTGEDMLKSAGVYGKRKPRSTAANLGRFAGGIGLEIALDPLTYLTLGSSAGLQALKKAGMAEDIVPAAAAKLKRGADSPIGPLESRLKTNTREVTEFSDHADELERAFEAKATEKAVQQAAGKKGLSEAQMEEKLAPNVFRWRLPFGLVDVGFGGEKTARAIDKTLGGIRYSPIGRQAAGIFSKGMRSSRHSAEAQKNLKETGRQMKTAHAMSREKMYEPIEVIAQSRYLDTGLDAEKRVRRSGLITDLLENVGRKGHMEFDEDGVPIGMVFDESWEDFAKSEKFKELWEAGKDNPEFVKAFGEDGIIPALSRMKELTREIIDKGQEWGVKEHELDDLFMTTEGYFPRVKMTSTGPVRHGRDRQIFNVQDPFDTARHPYLKNIQGGTAQLNRMSLDINDANKKFAGMYESPRRARKVSDAEKAEKFQEFREVYDLDNTTLLTEAQQKELFNAITTRPIKDVHGRIPMFELDPTSAMLKRLDAAYAAGADAIGLRRLIKRNARLRDAPQVRALESAIEHLHGKEDETIAQAQDLVRRGAEATGKTEDELAGQIEITTGKYGDDAAGGGEKVDPADFDPDGGVEPPSPDELDELSTSKADEELSGDIAEKISKELDALNEADEAAEARGREIDPEADYDSAAAKLRSAGYSEEFIEKSSEQEILEIAADLNVEPIRERAKPVSQWVAHWREQSDLPAGGAAELDDGQAAEWLLLNYDKSNAKDLTKAGIKWKTGGPGNSISIPDQDFDKVRGWIDKQVRDRAFARSKEIVRHEMGIPEPGDAPVTQAEVDFLRVSQPEAFDAAAKAQAEAAAAITGAGKKGAKKAVQEPVDDTPIKVYTEAQLRNKTVGGKNPTIPPIMKALKDEIVQIGKESEKPFTWRDAERFNKKRKVELILDAQKRREARQIAARKAKEPESPVPSSAPGKTKRKGGGLGGFRAMKQAERQADGLLGESKPTRKEKAKAEAELEAKVAKTQVYQDLSAQGYKVSAFKATKDGGFEATMESGDDFATLKFDADGNFTEATDGRNRTFNQMLRNRQRLPSEKVINRDMQPDWDTPRAIEDEIGEAQAIGDSERVAQLELELDELRQRNAELNYQRSEIWSKKNNRELIEKNARRVAKEVGVQLPKGLRAGTKEWNETFNILSDELMDMGREADAEKLRRGIEPLIDKDNIYLGSTDPEKYDNPLSVLALAQNNGFHISSQTGLSRGLADIAFPDYPFAGLIGLQSWARRHRINSWMGDNFMEEEFPRAVEYLRDLIQPKQKQYVPGQAPTVKYQSVKSIERELENDMITFMEQYDFPFADAQYQVLEDLKKFIAKSGGQRKKHLEAIYERFSAAQSLDEIKAVIEQRTGKKNLPKPKQYTDIGHDFEGESPVLLWWVDEKGNFKSEQATRWNTHETAAPGSPFQGRIDPNTGQMSILDTKFDGGPIFRRTVKKLIEDNPDLELWQFPDIGSPMPPKRLYQGDGDMKFGEIEIPQLENWLEKPDKVTITLFQFADKSTLPHEFGHLWRHSLRTLGDGLLEEAESLFKVRNSDWSGTAVYDGKTYNSAEEAFADAFMDYIGAGGRGKVNSRLARVMEGFKQFLSSLYNKYAKGTPAEQKFDPELRQFFDRMRGEPPKISEPVWKDLHAMMLETKYNFDSALDKVIADLGDEAVVAKSVVLLERFNQEKSKALRLAKEAGEDMDAASKHWEDLTKRFESSLSAAVEDEVMPKQIMGIQTDVNRTEILKQFDIDPDIYKDVTHVYRDGQQLKLPDALQSFLGGGQGGIGWYDAYQNLFKTHVTATNPGFHVRNFTSGFVQNMLNNVFDPDAPRWKRYWKPYQDAKSLMTGNVVEGLANAPIFREHNLTDEQATELLRRMVFSHGLMDSPGQHRDLVASLGDSVSEMIPGVERRAGLIDWIKHRARPEPNQTALSNIDPTAVAGARGSKDSFILSRYGRAVGDMVESLHRIGGFTALLKQGYDPVEAASRIKLLHVDYTNLSAAEREVFRRAMPFYSFTRGMAEYVGTELATRPGGPVAMTIKGANRASDRDTSTPDYVSEGLSFPLSVGPDGTRNYLTGLGLMHEQPVNLMTPDPQRFLFGLGSMLSPAIKAPLEATFNESLFQSSPQGGRSLDDMDPLLGRMLSNMGNTLGMTDREAPYRFPKMVELGLANSPAARYLSTARVAFDPRKSLLAKGLGIGSGLRISTISPAAQDAILRERAEEIIRKLGGKVFERPYIPDEELAVMSPEERAQAEMWMELMQLLGKRTKERKKAKEAEASSTN